MVELKEILKSLFRLKGDFAKEKLSNEQEHSSLRESNAKKLASMQADIERLTKIVNAGIPKDVIDKALAVEEKKPEKTNGETQVHAVGEEVPPPVVRDISDEKKSTEIKKKIAKIASVIRHPPNKKVFATLLIGSLFVSAVMAVSLLGVFNGAPITVSGINGNVMYCHNNGTWTSASQNITVSLPGDSVYVAYDVTAWNVGTTYLFDFQLHDYSNPTGLPLYNNITRQGIANGAPPARITPNATNGWDNWCQWMTDTTPDHQYIITVNVTQTS
jgi:hypothetical protein